MSRFYLRLILIPIAFFTLVLILIHAQPYDDQELRELLLPEGCPAPCFMGIRPGVTTVDEAVKLLEASGWVENIEIISVSDVQNIVWHWNNQKPNWIKEKLRAAISINGKIVYTITIQSEFLLGQTRLTFGLPDIDFVGSPQDPSEHKFLYEAFYPQYIIRAWLPCHIIEPFRQSVEITLRKSSRNNDKRINSLNDISHAC